jgi:hypothetical protein
MAVCRLRQVHASSRSGGPAAWCRGPGIGSRSNAAKLAVLCWSPDAHFCVKYQAHSAFHKNTSRAWTFSRDAGVSDVIGIILSAQTGYDQHTRISYKVGNRAHQVCGLNGPPAGSSPAPKLVVAGAP